MGATYNEFLLTCDGSLSKVQILQVLQLGNRVRNGCENDVRCSMGDTESRFHSLVMAVPARSSSFKFCSLEIASGMAVRMTSGVAWVLHRAGCTYSPATNST